MGSVNVATTTTSGQAPDISPATSDPGDETGRRFMYQWTYAAICCCSLLDDSVGLVEVFCEHHEDVLLKAANGSYIGVQIKTRESTRPLWKTSDDEVRSSCVRFAKLEREFPGYFERYRFLTKHPLHSAKNGTDLRHVLSVIRAAGSSASVTSPALPFLRRIAKDAGCTIEVAYAALAKAEASDDLPKLADVTTRLATTLEGVWQGAEQCPAPTLRKAANHLAWHCSEASTLAHKGLLPAYLPVMVGPNEAELTARLDGKRIDRARLLKVLDDGLHQSAPLHGSPDHFTKPGEGSGNLLLQKLDAGGFSAVSRNSAVDLRDKADYLGLMWLQKYGRDQGLQRYGHVQSLVLADAARAYENAKAEVDPFGLKMLDGLRERFRLRRVQGSQLYDCSNEHLEGVAYALTARCQVQWSVAKPWESK